ncbi:hypothetical protein [Lactobacillus delbrueckii]|uniref:hypothetical protein n=1 Tax=Lactobacillus delbrueckii TaxID=1584 RepID=UPI00331320FA
MKYFIWAYNPKVVGIRPSKGISFVVPETKTEAYLELEINQIIPVKRIDFQTVYPIFKKSRLKEKKLRISLPFKKKSWTGWEC